MSLRELAFRRQSDLSVESGVVKRTRAVDSVFSAFSDRLPGPVRDAADRLTELLELAPAEVPWSRVFSQEITLAAPALVFDLFPHLPVREAVCAHMLATIEGIAVERVASGRIEMSPILSRLLSHLRLARDGAIASISAGNRAPELRFDLAFEQFEEVLSVERDLFEHPGLADFFLYDRVVAGKQVLMLPASNALALAAGWPPEKRQVLRQMLTAIGVGLRMCEDVMDWEEADVQRGAWAVALAKKLDRRAPGAKSKPPLRSVRHEVLESGVLALLLRRADRCFILAKKLARSLGLHDLARWAAVQSLALDELQRDESTHAGYCVRAKCLRGWARDFLT